jgi:ectoine hydroxylase-related dioxygenase (phytanoyl-CoA dioxygenase family)
MFKEADLQIEFNNIGFVKLKLFSEDDLLHLKDVYEITKNQSGLDLPFYTSIWSNNQVYKNKVDLEIKKIFNQRIDKYITGFKAVFGNFMVKKNSEKSDLIPHQDWNFVDEEFSYSITIWAPLTGVNKDNGALEVFPKSHIKYKNFIRPRFADSVFLKDLNHIKENCMECIDMKAGEALFINPRLIHGSSINKSINDRIAATLVVTEKEASLLHYVELKDIKKIVKLEVDSSFFIRHSCYDNPILHLKQ